MDVITIWFVAWILALVFAFWKLRWVEAQSQGNDEIAKIAGHIRNGAMAFLNREYRVLGIFVAVVAVLLFLAYNSKGQGIIALAFVLGAFCSGLAGFIGMWAATASNSRTTNAARTSLNDALIVAFSGGSVMGMCVAGLGVWSIVNRPPCREFQIQVQYFHAIESNNISFFSYDLAYWYRLYVPGFSLHSVEDPIDMTVETIPTLDTQ